MAIKRQEFYEGAALYQLLRGCATAKVTFSAPFFELNDRLRLHLKYSTAVRGPWAFTFMPEEQQLLASVQMQMPLVVGLICGSSGVAAIPAELLFTVARTRDVAVRVACTRRHREHFEVSGPDGTAPGKIPPGRWQNLLSDRWQR